MQLSNLYRSNRVARLLKTHIELSRKITLYKSFYHAIDQAFQLRPAINEFINSELDKWTTCECRASDQFIRELPSNMKSKSPVLSHHLLQDKWSVITKYGLQRFDSKAVLILCRTETAEAIVRVVAMGLLDQSRAKKETLFAEHRFSCMHVNID